MNLRKIYYCIIRLNMTRPEPSNIRLDFKMRLNCYTIKLSFLKLRSRMIRLDME